MLKITREAEKQIVRLKLEGKLIGPWVAECSLAVAAEVSDGRVLALDLSEVTYVDRAGVRLLEQLLSEGARIEACSNFVAELLGLEKLS